MQHMTTPQEGATPQEGRTDRGDGVALAWVRTPGREPTTVFLPGYMSDMAGTKAMLTEAFCRERGLACLRLDYSGHGASDGAFTDGTVGRWTDDALALIDAQTEGKLVLVGSSMGGWIALLAAVARTARVAGLIGIAAAPDFTEELMWQAMMPDERVRLERDGVLHIPSQYGDSTPVTAALIADGRRRLLLDRPIALNCPVRLLHGQRDPDVPWETSMRLAERLQSDDVEVTLVKEGDHRLSRPSDLALLRRTLGGLLLQDRA